MSRCTDQLYKDFTRLTSLCVCVCVSIPGVFNECHNSDQERTQKLLVRVSPFWGRTTCLRLALEADDKNFVALSGVQVERTFLTFETFSFCFNCRGSTAHTQTATSLSAKNRKPAMILNLVDFFFF